MLRNNLKRKFESEIRYSNNNYPMIRLNIDQQTDEVRDIENYIRDFDPIAVVELQSQQVRRLLYFAKKGIRSYKDYKAKMNPSLNNEINLSEGDD
jgi:hypothetical protein